MALFSKERATLGRWRERSLADDRLYFRLGLSLLASLLVVALLAASVLVPLAREKALDESRERALAIVEGCAEVGAALATFETGKLDSPEMATRRVDLARGRLALVKGQLRQEAQRKLAADLDALLGRWQASLKARGAIEGSEGAAESTRLLLALEQGALAELGVNEGQALRMDKTFQALVSLPILLHSVTEMDRSEAGWRHGQDKKWVEANGAAIYRFNNIAGHLVQLLEGDAAAVGLLDKARTSVARWQSEVARPSFGGGPAVAGRAPLFDQVRPPVAELKAMLDGRMAAARRSVAMWRTVKLVGFGALGLAALGVTLGSSFYIVGAFRGHFRKVRDAEVRMRALLDSTPDGILLFNNQGVIVSLNAAAEKMFGVTGAEVVGKGIKRIVPKGLELESLAHQPHLTVTATGARGGSQTFPAEINVSPMEDDSGQRFVAIIRDITDRRRSEETLRVVGAGISAATGEEFLRLIVKQLSKALQTDYAFIVEITRTPAGVTSSLTLSDRSQVRLIPKFNLAATFCDDILRRGFQVVPADARKVYPDDQLLRDLGVESLVATPLVDHRGRAVGLLGVLHAAPMVQGGLVESTLQIFAARAAAEVERKRSAEDLAAEKERLAITLRSIGDGFIATDVNGKIHLMNPVAERLTGWVADEANGKHLTEVFRLYNDRTRGFAENAVNRIIETGSAVGAASSASIVARDGQQRMIETTASPIRDRTNRKIGVVLVFKDVTEREKLEEERRKAEKLESLGVAAGGIAHDFNNLLTAIIGNLSLALTEVDPDEGTAERLRTAKKASLRAQELAQQLLTFAKGGAPIKKTATVGQMVQDTVKFSLRGSNVRCQFDIAEDLWPCEIDPGQISQVITNLTVNAEQAMPAGGTLQVVCRNFESAGGPIDGQPLRSGRFVRISVRDEGIGIPEELVTRIFDPYFTTKPKGSGLGLATAYSIIKNHEGLITVQSKPGEGTMFDIYLPASDRPVTPEVPLAPASRPSHGAPSGKQRGRILVLDDEEVICALVSATLEPAGYEVFEATDAATAIHAYEEALHEGKPFDVLISDLTIPGGMGGLEALKILREIDPHIRAIVSSGYATDPIMSRFREYGFIACISKPYEVSALLRIVDDVVHGGRDEEVASDFVSAQLG